jgi:1-acyl-sn-glycerol-3-phosphate acyltransferase
MTVSNHISYLDVLVAAAQLPTLFVTSIEMRDEPFVGWICRLAGCVFVERRSPRRLRAEIAELSALLRHGFHVVLFPEATSTRGTGVRPFRRALFEAARDAAVPLWVAQVQYPEGVRMRVSYAEDDAFLPHLRRLLVTHELRAEWTWLSLLEGTEIVSHSSQELASWAHSQIEAQFQPSPLLASAI